MAGILDTIFPRKCPFCRNFLTREEEVMCAACAKALPRPEGTRTRKRGEFFSACTAPLVYKGAVRESIIRYKFHGRTSYRTCYAKLVAQRVRAELEGKYDVLTWAPVSFIRLMSRGYDQTKLLCTALGKELGIKPVRALTRVRHSKPQTRAGTPEKRRANVLGAYRVRNRSAVEGKRVLIIDDIITTGATLSEAAKTLLMAGAEDVVAAAIAMTAENTPRGAKNPARTQESR